ncbi:MAG: hypothetical protein KDA88_22570 [Planctomycetaceae bacterium]|nr:hypothetical protein [Planctomycetaceae bacterium]
MNERIETIKAFHECRNFGNADKLRTAQRNVAAAYHSLSSEEFGTLTRFAVDSGNGDILSHLACFQPGSLSGLHLELAQKGVLYPPVIFHGADQQATNLLIEQLDNGEAENVNLSLLALAWADNSDVRQAFHSWRATPPSWSKSLHVPPHEYADSAGWELAENGERRGLILNESYPLVTHDHPDAVPGAVQTNAPSESSCQWCGRRMTALFDFDLSNALLASLGIEGSRLRIETCDVCTCYGMVFTQVDWSGGTSWHPGNIRPDYLPDDAADWDFPKANALVLSDHQRPITESADRNMPISFSQVGGHPSWEQDAEYPRCPSCQHRMVFIAQISNEDYAAAEGIYYAFICQDCRVAATHYQQT